MQQSQHPLPGILGNLAVVLNALQQLLRAQVGGQDQNGILKVHSAALGVGDPAVVQNLEKNIEYIRMGLLHLIKQHHAVGLSADGFGELTAFLIAHISGRRSDQTGDGEFLHIFGHIDSDHVVFVIKQGFRQGLCQLRFADTGGAQEQEGADGPVGVLNTRTAALDGLRHGADGLILAHHTPVKNGFQIQELLPLPLYQAADGNAGPALHDFGDFFVGDLVAQQGSGAVLLNPALLLLQLLLSLGKLAVFQFGGFLQIIALLGGFYLPVQILDVFPKLLNLADGSLFVVPLGLLCLEAFPLLCQLLLNLGKTALGAFVFFLLQGGLLNFQLDDLPVDLVQLRGHGVHFRSDLGAGFIDQVNGLVRQEPVGDIPVGKGGGGNDGRVRDLDTVEHLIPFLQAPENGNGVLHRGLIYRHGLEPALQCGVLFNILAVFVQGGGADAVQLAPGQHGLQQIARIHATFGLSGAHDGVQLIDEQQDLAIGLLYFVENGFEPLLEFAPVFGAGHQRAHIQGEDALIL